MSLVLHDLHVLTAVFCRSTTGATYFVLRVWLLAIWNGF